MVRVFSTTDRPDDAIEREDRNALLLSAMSQLLGGSVPGIQALRPRLRRRRPCARAAAAATTSPPSAVPAELVALAHELADAAGEITRKVRDSGHAGVCSLTHSLALRTHARSTSVPPSPWTSRLTPRP